MSVKRNNCCCIDRESNDLLVYKTLTWALNQRKDSSTSTMKTHTLILWLTRAICFRDQQHGVENLVFVLLIQDFALAEVGRELGWGDGPAQVVAFALHLLPQRLHIVAHPRSPVFHLSPPEEQKIQQELCVCSVCKICIRAAETKRCSLQCTWADILYCTTVSHNALYSQLLHRAVFRLRVSQEIAFCGFSN